MSISPPSSIRVYVAPFHAIPVQSASATLAEMVWPYDNGDDPSFHARRKFGGPLTWGVCRADVRNLLKEGDITLFFSFQERDDRELEYRFCSIATVVQKVSQADIWEREDLGILRNYCNLLIRPSTSSSPSFGWDHYEPCLAGPHAHKDWLWRIVRRNGLKSKEFGPFQKTDHFGPGSKIGTQVLELSDNYVIFSSDPSLTVVLSHPPVVATCSKGQLFETWREDGISQGIKKRVLEQATHHNQRQRFLRTKNVQRSHRHIVFELPAAEANVWRADLVRFVEQADS